MVLLSLKSLVLDHAVESLLVSLLSKVVLDGLLRVLDLMLVHLGQSLVDVWLVLLGSETLLNRGCSLVVIDLVPLDVEVLGLGGSASQDLALLSQGA